MIKIFKILLLVVAIAFSVAHAERNALWQNLGPEGGWAGSIVVAPGDPDILYARVLYPAGSNDNVLFRSSDGGDSWVETTRIGTDRNMDAIVVAPDNPDKLYVAFSSRSKPVSGVLISNDGGVHWRRGSIEDFVIFDGSAPSVTAMVADPNHSDVAYFSANTQFAAIYQTTDGSENWFRVNQTPLNNANASAQTLLIDPATGTLYAHWSGVGIAPSKSTDNGRTWEVLSGLPAGASVRALALDPAASNGLYAIINTSSDSEIMDSALYHSTDGGLHWSLISQEVPLSLLQQMIVHPLATELFYISAGESSYRSDDGGVSWRPLENGGWLAIDSNDPDRLYLASGRGVLRSNDRGISSELANHGIPYSIIEQVVIDPNTAGVVYTSTNSGLFKSEDSGHHWRLLDNVPPMGIFGLVINPADSRVLYAGRFRSNDAGESWFEMNPDLPAVTNLTLVANAPDLLYATGLSISAGEREIAILRSNDGGEHWSSTLTDGFPAGETIVDLQADPVDPARLYAIGWGCVSFFCSYILYKSEDSGDHWHRIRHGGRVGGDQLRIDPHNPQTLYLLTPGILHRSNDSGETWQRFELSPPYFARSLALDAHTPDTLYIGAGVDDVNSVILRSRDGGRSWLTINNTTVPGGHFKLEFDRHSNALYSGSSANGLSQVIPDYPVIWWDATRSGQGLSLWPRDDRLWGAWFLYDKNGEPIWLLFEGKPDNGLITAPLLQFKGPALGAAWNTSQAIGEEVGQIALDISNPQAPQLNAVVNGVNQSIDLDLSAFRPQADGPLSGVWWDPEQSGQGIVLSQQGDDLWGVFHRYDESGDDIWVIFQGQFQGNILNAELLHFTGPTLGAAWNESLVLDSSVGQVTVEQQAADQLIFNYTLNGHSSVLNLQPF